MKYLLFLGICLLSISVVNAADIVSLDCTHKGKNGINLYHLDVDMKNESADVILGDNSWIEPVTITPTKIIVGKKSKRLLKIFTISRETLSYTYEISSKWGSGKYEGTCKLVTREIKNKF